MSKSGGFGLGYRPAEQIARDLAKPAPINWAGVGPHNDLWGAISRWENSEPGGEAHSLAGVVETVAMTWARDRFLAMPPADRIALARELLAGTGRVVVRDCGEMIGERGFEQKADGWNAARAALSPATEA